jgi:YrbI family 3-deoxy-D-manno-octulosonate 8-phosphate phosphatase
MYYDSDGDRLKRFNTRDGKGLARWREGGGMAAIVTTEDTPIVKQRAKKLGIDDVHVGVADKLAVVTALAQKHGVSLQQTAMIGDDLNDLEALRAVGMSACPLDAEPAIRSVVDYICERKGGAGCVREFADLLLAARGL